MQNPFAKAIRKHSGRGPAIGEQKRLGKPRPAGLTDEHANFLKLVLGFIDAGTIDTKRPESFINDRVYRGLSDGERAKVDLATPNIASFLERIMDLHARPEKDESIEMKNLIETLWQAKERIEQYADVFIF